MKIAAKHIQIIRWQRAPASRVLSTSTRKWTITLTQKAVAISLQPVPWLAGLISCNCGKSGELQSGSRAHCRVTVRVQSTVLSYNQHRDHSDQHSATVRIESTVLSYNQHRDHSPTLQSGCRAQCWVTIRIESTVLSHNQGQEHSAGWRAQLRSGSRAQCRVTIRVESTVQDREHTA